MDFMQASNRRRSKWVVVFWFAIVAFYMGSLLIVWNSNTQQQLRDKPAVWAQEEITIVNKPPIFKETISEDVKENKVVEPIEKEGEKKYCVTEPTEPAVPLSDHQLIVEGLLAKLTQVTTSLKLQNNQLARINNPIPVEATPVRLPPPSENTFRIATYNLWNLNGNWKERIEKIAELITELSFDIVALQEVRTIHASPVTNLKIYNFSKDQLLRDLEGVHEYPGTPNSIQLQTLLEKLPEFHYAVFISTADQPGRIHEGIAIISKFPIREVNSWDMSIRGYSDQNTRGLLHAQIEIPSGQLVDVFNAHFPYDQLQQCPTVVKLHEILQSPKFLQNLRPQFLLGDLNTYMDFEWPIDFIQDPYTYMIQSPSNPCAPVFEKYPAANISLNFVDLWTAKFPRNPDGKLTHPVGGESQALGYTFPLFKDNALDNCRPDRILFRDPSPTQQLKSTSVITFGGEPYFSQSRRFFLSDHLGVLAVIKY